MKYRADIEGLRAVAVLPVLLFHAGLKTFGGGFVGVDIFFVISGYVIAGTLEKDFQASQYSLLRFYSKRIRRIFPALFFTIILAAGVGWFVMLPSFYNGFFESVIAATTFVSNIYFWKDSGYFATAALSRPLLHTWSLSVEEQYYLFAPILLYFTYTYLKRRWLLTLVPLLALSFVASSFATTLAPTANFFLLPTRAWELLAGALLALRPPPPLKEVKWAVELLGFTGLALISYGIFFLSDTSPFPGPNALFPCCGALFVIYAGSSNSRSLASQILSMRPVVQIGKISYSLYLVHWPVIVFFYFLTLTSPTNAQIVPIILISFALAYFSWKFVETPFRHLEGAEMQSRLIGGGIVVIIVFTLFGLVGKYYHGFPSRFPNFVEQKIEGKELWNSGSCFLEGDPDPSKWSYEKCKIIVGKNETALLWGDSFAAQYVPGLVANQDHIPFDIVQYTAAGCPPILTYKSYARPHCEAFNANALDVIRQHGIKTVVLSARWTDMQSRGIKQLMSTLDALDKLGVKTYVIGQSPEFSIDVQVIAFAHKSRAPDHVEGWKVFFDPQLNKDLKAFAGADRFIDPMQSLCKDNICPYEKNGTFLFSDYGHFSSEGSAEAVQLYFPLYR